MLQQILDLFNHISASLDAISAKLSGLSGGLTATEAQQIKDAAAVLAQKAEQLVQ